MTDGFDRAKISRDQEPTVHRKTSQFQEVPGEDEADAVSHAFLQGAGRDPDGVASALSRADDGTRARALHRLQQEQGNTYVQRVIGEPRGTPGRLVGLPQSEMVAEVLQRKGSGSPLPDSTQARMGDYFGADLSGVRVHTDDEAAALNRELDARAFTTGSDIFVAEGRYRPDSIEGQSLLAHELAHVGQQTGFGGAAVQRQPEGEEEVQRPAEEQEEEAAV